MSIADGIVSRFAGALVCAAMACAGFAQEASRSPAIVKPTVIDFPPPHTVSKAMGLKPGEGGTAQVQLDPMGENRYDNLMTVDLRLDRTFRFGAVSLVPAIDVFNLTNSNTVLAQNRNQAATNANVISGIMPPRVMRFNVAVRW